MKNLAASISLNLLGNISSQASRFSTGFKSLAESGKKSLGSIVSGANKVESSLGNIFNKTTGILGGLGLGVSGKYVADMNTRLARLGIISGKSKEEIEALNNEIMKVAQNRNINVDPSDILGAVETISNKVGNIDFSTADIENLGYVLSATGATAEDVGGLFSNLYDNFDIKTPKEMLSTIGAFSSQMKMGGISLSEITKQSERITAAFSETGRTGSEAAIEMTTMLQMAVKGAGGLQKGTTAFESLLKDFKNIEVKDKLKAANISLVDPKDPSRMRSMIDISKDLITLTKGNTDLLGNVLSPESLTALRAMTTEYKNNGDFATTDGFLNASRDEQSVIKDSTEMAKEFNSAATSLKTAFSSKVLTELTPYMQKLADAMNKMSPEDIGKYLEYAKKVFIGLGALWGGSKIIGLGSKLFGMLKGGTGGALASATSQPIPVYIVNAPEIAKNMNSNSTGSGFLQKAILAASVASLTQTGSILADFYENGVSQTVNDYKENWGGTDWINPSKMAAVAGDYLGDKIGGWLFGNESPAEKMKKAEEEAQKKFGMGALFDEAKRYDAMSAQKKAEELEAMTPISNNNIHISIDKDGIPSLKKQDGNINQTKISTDIGYTRLPNYEA